MMDNQYTIRVKENLQSLYQKFIDDGISPALGVCVADMEEDKQLFSFYGGSEQPNGKGTKVTQNTLFHIASVTKIITAILIGILIERGKLSLLDSLKSFFKECPYEEVTIYHLLTHTAGFTVTAGMKTPTTIKEKEELYKLIFAQKREHYAGERLEYFSYYYILLGDIIERLSGMELNEFAKSELFLPLGMNNTFYGAKTARGRELVNFYSQTKGDIIAEVLNDMPLGDAGIMSTAQELVRIGQLILNKGIYNGKRIFSSATAEMLCRECTGGKFDRAPAFFTKGNSIIPDNASMSAVAHHGMTGCILFIDPEYKICAAVTGNGEKMHIPLNYQHLLSAAIPLCEAE